MTQCDHCGNDLQIDLLIEVEDKRHKGDYFLFCSPCYRQYRRKQEAENRAKWKAQSEAEDRAIKGEE